MMQSQEDDWRRYLELRHKKETEKLRARVDELEQQMKRLINSTYKRRHSYASFQCVSCGAEQEEDHTIGCETRESKQLLEKDWK